jgi:hypothetical protein
MSQFGGGNFMQSLAGLFGQQQNQQQGGFGQQGHSRPAAYSPYQMPSFMSGGVPGSYDTMGGLFGGGLQHDRNVRQMYENLMSGGRQQQAGGPTAGQALAGFAAQDAQRAEQARQQELAYQMQVLGNLFGGMQGAGQMVQDARGAAGQNMGLMDRQAQQMREAADQGNRYFEESQRQMMSGLNEARRRMDEGIGTMRQARAGFDASYRGDTAAEVMGVQQQYKNQLDQIARRDDLTQEQKDMMTGELQQGMRQQSAGLAAQASVRARDTMLALDQNIAQMQSMAGQTLGQFGIGIGQMTGQLGAQQAAMRQQNEQAIAGFYSNMAQFNQSQIQNAQATALQYMLNGNQLASNIIQNAPFGPISLFGTFANMIRSVDADRGQPVGALGNLMGGLA